MILYHTSNTIIKNPNISYSRNHLDFGKGFYLTSLQEQAKKYGQRFLKRGEKAFLNIYELDDDISDFSRIIFDSYDDKWLDFVTACRKGLPHKLFDIIEGGIADDQVFDTIDLYFSDIYTKEQALNQLKYKQPNHQICISNQSLIDTHLHYINSIELPCSQTK